MTSEVVVALLAAVASLIVAALTAWRSGANSRRLFELEQGAKRDDRVHTAKEELDRYREPLLRATLDLASRIDNIRNKGILDKYLLSDDRRSKIARVSTFYRFAQYWSVVESLYGSVALVRFEQDEQTRPVADQLRKVGRTFATDDYGPQFMMWRDEQRAVAELMRLSATPHTGTIGFAQFFEQYDGKFASWFEQFDRDLSPTTARESERFRHVQRRLAMLATQLDTFGTYERQRKKLLEAAERPDRSGDVPLP